MFTRLMSRLSKRSEKPALVSLVIPCFNVEQYLEEAVASLTSQSYETIEILLIDDGSTDTTLHLAKMLRRTDKRIRVFTQQNSGLSATRNRGIELARGRYVWFIDSDDKIPTQAVETFVTTLEETGSDFAVGSYDRFNSSRTWNAALWIREAHRTERLATTLDEFPEATVNAIACSKVFRRSFLLENQIRFPVGITYEDQQVTAKCYAIAKSFDFLSSIVYNWRDREDGTSITQQFHTLKDLEARLNAATESLRILESLAGPEAAMTRRIQVLSNDLPTSTSVLQETSEEFWSTLQGRTSDLVGPHKARTLRETPPHQSAMLLHILNDDRQSALNHLRANASNVNNYSSQVLEGHVYLSFAGEDYAFPANREVSMLPERYLVQYSGIEDFSRSPSGALEISGWSFISRADPTQIDYKQSLQLRNKEGRIVLEIECSPRESDVPDFFSKHIMNDYRRSGFLGTLSLSDITDLRNGAYDLWVKTSTELGDFTQPLIRTLKSRYFGHPSSLNLQGSARRIRLSAPRNATVQLLLTSTVAMLTDIQATPGNTNSVRVQIESTKKLESLTLQDQSTGDEAVLTLVQNEHLYYCDIKVDRLKELTASNSLVTRAVASTTRKRHAIGWDDTIDGANFQRMPKVRAYRATSGNFTFAPIPQDEVQITFAHFENDHIIIEGDLQSQISSAKFRLGNSKVETFSPTIGPGHFSVSIPLSFEKWGTSRKLPVGSYELRLCYVDDDQRELYARINIASSAIRSLPAERISPEENLSARIYWRNKYSLSLKINTFFGPDNASPREKAKRLDEYRRNNDPVQKDVWLMRSYYGESVSCVPKALGAELLGDPNAIVYFAVKDNSITVPMGSIPVQYGSREWYKLLATCGVYVDNTHQPDYFEKRDGQKLVATFHGYPFKVCGEPLWEMMGLSSNRKESFARRHRQWDVLISPAPYATPPT